MTEGVSDPINIEVDIVVDVEVELTTNLKLQLVPNESLGELVHILAIVGKMLTEEINKFISFSFDDGGRA
ncbi:hypothetical protein J1N35_019294 [Gossypium stocksii]|uniref:Uncharacterized protein n=1 Tax=Gossypium stocksii TaxID=47602 RepID=A0A9D3VRW4_9ROSI|nr:hypothetical protein J1N35_019294 [Gossypium stocksii]